MQSRSTCGNGVSSDDKRPICTVTFPEQAQFGLNFEAVESENWIYVYVFLIWMQLPRAGILTHSRDTDFIHFTKLWVFPCDRDHTILL